MGYVVEEADESIHWLEMIEGTGIAAGSRIEIAARGIKRTVQNFQPIAADRENKCGRATTPLTLLTHSSMKLVNS